jgi:subtilisin family serine protease
MRTLRLAIIVGALFALTLPLVAQTSYILTVSPANAPSVISNHGLQVVKELYDGSLCVYLVTSPSADVNAVEVEVESDTTVSGFEAEQTALLPEKSQLTQATLTQSTAGILDFFLNRTPVTFFGSSVPSYYLTQPATTVIRLNDGRNATNLTGRGIVAIIDTGVDLNHPLLTGVLVPGYDFTRDIPSASELADLNPATAAALQQSTAGILDANNVYILNNATAAFLNQSTAGILDQSTAGILDGVLGTLPEDFGHGTMVAGVVHLVAPSAGIMPLKAFRADGSSNLSDIIRAIYYAADHGASVLSMSFSMSQSSRSLQAAVNYALNKGVVVVAASGNDGLKTLVYPASIGGVDGIGSTSNADARSTFSNFGSGVVALAAPGEGVITSYPGGNYAAGWGTSFSAPMVAGAASLVLQARPSSKPGDVLNALSKAKSIGSDMGYGRIDLYQALTNLVGGTLSTSTSGSNTSGSTSGGSPKP